MVYEDVNNFDIVVDFFNNLSKDVSNIFTESSKILGFFQERLDFNKCEKDNDCDINLSNMSSKENQDNINALACKIIPNNSTIHSLNKTLAIRLKKRGPTKSIFSNEIFIEEFNILFKSLLTKIIGFLDIEDDNIKKTFSNELNDNLSFIKNISNIKNLLEEVNDKDKFIDLYLSIIQLTNSNYPS
jgi:hypothetical protein